MNYLLLEKSKVLTVMKMLLRFIFQSPLYGGEDSSRNTDGHFSF